MKARTDRTATTGKAPAREQPVVRSHTPQPCEDTPRVVLITLLGLIGVSALPAAWGFLVDPSGRGIGIPQEWLAESPFRDYRIPGAVLLGLGIFHLAAAGRQVLRRSDAWAWAGASGILIIGWIGVQIALMGYTRHPIQTTLQTSVLAVGAATVALAFVQYRAWHLTWGTLGDESRAAMPGDGTIEDPHFLATRAVTVDAGPEDVWPWIAQMGFGRAGFYSYDLLDNAGRPSANVIEPRLEVGVGGRIPMSNRDDARTSFCVTEIDHPRFMVWTKDDSTWAWLLRRLPDGRTRLVTRIRLRYEWRSPLVLLSLFLMEIGDFIMMRRCLLGIKARAESRARGTAPEETRHAASGGR